MHDRFDTISTFNDRIKKDQIKTSYCDGQFGRPNLLRINYKDFNKIDNILKSFLFC